MKRFFYIILILAFLYFPFCKQEVSSNLSALEKEKLEKVIYNLSIISKLDTTKIEFMTDSIEVLLSGVEEFEDYLTNISSDSLLNLEEMLEIYKSINVKMKVENPQKDKRILPGNPRR